MILYGDELIKKIREEFDKATSRIWITVPFIGDWNQVKKIMGTKWLTSDFDIKLITDIRNDGFINSETIKQYLLRSEVKTLAGLHAKIYIIDNCVFITSANLTGTAFSKRYEICHFETITNDHEILSVFNKWWNIAKKVDVNWQPSEKEKSKISDIDAGNIAGLKKLWNLPETSVRVTNFKDYQDIIASYNHILKIYESDGDRLLPKLTSYHELDAFFNYRFHEDKNTPSHKFLKEDYRELTPKDRNREIKKYKAIFKKWLVSNLDYEDYRRQRVELVHMN